MITKQFTYSFRELNILPGHIGKLMGFENGPIPEPFPEMISAEIEAVSELSDIKGGYRILDCSIPDSHTILAGGQTFEIGRTINRFVSNSTRIAVFVCTAGQRISDRITKLAGQGLLNENYITDVIGTVAAERAMDRIHDALKREMEDQGLKITNRYSPGYCDWKVGEQNQLFSLLPDTYCGVRLTDSSLMIPIKSVSGIIGIGEKVVFKDYSCELCSGVNCIYRNKRS